jgi:hypothetical protein
VIREGSVFGNHMSHRVTGALTNKGSMALSDGQLRAISIAERVGGCSSLLGCMFITTTYCASAALRKPVNRLIFYASFGNVFSAVAALMSRDGVTKGRDSALCLAQAFFIQ